MAIRTLSTAMQNAIAAGTVRPAVFYEGAFVSGGVVQYLRLWSGLGTTTWNGHDWIGAGDLLGISQVDESDSLTAVGFAVEISGMPAENVGLALGDIQQGQPGKLWLALFDADWAMIADPYPLRRGLTDYSVLQDDGATCSIKIQYEDRLINLEKPRERRYTSADQQIDYPSDLGFAYVPGLQDMSFTWA